MMQGPESYFDAVAHRYFRLYHEESPGGYALRVRKQRVLELLDREGGRVLDVGCGPGVMVQELLNLGYEFWGVDASPRMIEECHKNFGPMKGVHFSVGNAVSLDFPEGFFDVVICTGVIDRLPAYELAIRELVRVVKGNGTLLISFPNLLSPYAAWKRFIFYPTVARLQSLSRGLLRRPPAPSLLSSFAKLHTARAATRLLAAQGARCTEIVYFDFNLFLSPLDQLFPHGALKVTEKLERLRFGRLKWLGVGFIVKARKGAGG